MQYEVAKPMQLWDRMFGWQRRREALATIVHAGEWLQPGSRVLDIGCGLGYSLEVLESEFGCTAFGCDVIPAAKRVRRFARFDGRELPFADQSVDVAFIIFVLHHTHEPAALLREAARVAKRQLVVVEDTPRTALERMWCEFHIRSFSRRHCIPWRGRVRSEKEWRQFFSVLGYPVVAARDMGLFERTPPLSRTVYILQPTPARVSLTPARRIAHWQPKRRITS